MAKSIEGNAHAHAHAHTNVDVTEQTRFGVVPSSVADVPATTGAHPYCSSLKERFDCVRLLGSGGVGEVWLAHDFDLDRLVALKVMKRLRTGLMPSLLDEARATSLVRHPNVVSVLDAGTFRGELFIAFEYVEGATLRATLRRLASTRDSLDDRALVLRWLHEIAAGLAAAHDVGVLHLDVKPENVLIGAIDQRARVLDFGLARLRSAPAHVDEHAADGPTCVDVEHIAAGTPGYMAPELWTASEVCDGTDVWAFAVLAHEALTGNKLFTSTNKADLAAAVLDVDGAAPSLFGDAAKQNPALGEILGESLLRDRRARPRMKDVALELARAR